VHTVVDGSAPIYLMKLWTREADGGGILQRLSPPLVPETRLLTRMLIGFEGRYRRGPSESGKAMA